VWPASVAEGVSESRFHRRHVLSPEPVARKRPVGENEAQRIGEAWPVRRLRRYQLGVDERASREGRGWTHRRDCCCTC